MCAYMSGREPIASPQCTAESISRVRVRDRHLSCAALRAERLPDSKPFVSYTTWCQKTKEFGLILHFKIFKTRRQRMDIDGYCISTNLDYKTPVLEVKVNMRME
jgi:hypothetical protein